MKKILFTLSILCISNSVFSYDLTAFITDAATGPGTGSIDLTVGAGVAPFTYSWSGPSGFTATTEDISGLNYGTYTVTVTDLYCGVATYSWFVDSVSTIGIMEINENNSIFVYPNPGNNQITVTTNGTFQNASFNLKNLAGQLIMNQKYINGKSFSFDIVNEPTGVYLIEVLNENTCTRLKFIKN